GEEVVALKLESGDAQTPRLALAKRKPGDQGDIHLHRGAGDLAVALSEMGIARREQRPGHEYRNQKPAAFGQLLDVDVPRVLARRDGAQASARERPAVPAQACRHRVVFERLQYEPATPGKLVLALVDLLALGDGQGDPRGPHR